MKYLPIFALFLMFACCEVMPIKTQCFRVNFSDALPIQFWLNDCETYNESVPEGVHYKCFCHPWKCDDELRIQFTEDSDDAFILSVLDEDGDELATLDFATSALDGSPEIPGVTSPITLPALSSGQNISGPYTDWTTGANPSVTLTGAGSRRSDIWAEPYVFTPGYEYEFTPNLDYSFDTGSVLCRVVFVVLDGGNNIIFSYIFDFFGGDSGTLTTPVTFTAVSGETKYGFYVSSNNPFDIGDDTFDINSITATQTTPDTPAVPATTWANQVVFIPSDHGICEQKIKFEVINITESPDEVVAKSDCILISDDQPDPTVLFEYSNNRNFAGLIYEDLSPPQTFQIRVPAVFFHEKFPEEDEAIELSDSKIINLNGVVRAQRLFDSAHMPYYMHRKMKLIFKHQTLLTPIDDKYWTKQDAYEIDEGDRRWPVKKAKCWLTERDFVQRNVV